MPIVVVALACLVLTGASGCASSPVVSLGTDSSNRQLVAHQLIIKFKTSALTCDVAGIARLAADTGTSLEYVRPMSGGACVIKQSFSSGAGFLDQPTILKRHPAVEWLEQDQAMKTL